MPDIRSGDREKLVGSAAFMLVGSDSLALFGKTDFFKIINHVNGTSFLNISISSMLYMKLINICTVEPAMTGHPFCVFC